jgi:hypothetical protein
VKALIQPRKLKKTNRSPALGFCVGLCPGMED